MSLKTWKQEFYPIPASECPKEQAIQHSLRKWQGLTKENLEKHEVFYSRQFVAILEDALVTRSTEKLYITGATCALCFHYYKHREGRLVSCQKCPYERHFGHNCERLLSGPYFIFVRIGDPIPMIANLTELAEHFK